MLSTDQQRPGQVVAGEADLVQARPELDSLELGVVLADLAGLAPGAGGHHRPHVADPVVDVTHERAPPAHLPRLLSPSAPWHSPSAKKGMMQVGSSNKRFKQMRTNICIGCPEAPTGPLVWVMDLFLTLKCNPRSGVCLRSVMCTALIPHLSLVSLLILFH